MKNYFVIISIMIIFLIPLNVGALVDEPLLDNIADEKQPYVSSNLTLHNSNGELVGAIHFNTVLSKNNVIFGDNFIIPISKNMTIKDAQYQMGVPIQTEQIVDADCNNASQRAMGYGNIYDACFFYMFKTGYTPIVDVEGKKYAITVFDSLHHGFVVEEGDRVNIDWIFLIPTN